MIALLADEDFNGRIIRGLLRRVSDLDLLTNSAAGLAAQPDAVVIAWAAANQRVLITHDINTMTEAALERVRLGQPMPGVVAVPQQLGIGAAISDLALIVTCADPNELAGRIWYLPLQ
jgi:hypothetical protein